MDYIGTLSGAFSSIKGQIGTSGQVLVGISSIFAIIILVNKLIQAYSKAFEDGEKPASIKHIFSLFSIYIYAFITIVGAPVVFSIFEKGLGEFQEALVKIDQTSLSKTGDKYVEYLEEKWKEEEEEKGALQKVVDTVQGVLMPFLDELTKGVQIFFALAESFIFYLFLTGRYLYLLLLQIVAPFAVVFWLDSSTKQYTFTFLRNLFTCYMIAPALLIANSFVEELANIMLSDAGPGARFSIIVTALIFFAKMFLFSKAIQYTKELI